MAWCSASEISLLFGNSAADEQLSVDWGSLALWVFCLFCFATCTFNHLGLIRRDKVATLTPVGVKDPNGPTYRWDKNVWIAAYEERELSLVCGGIYDRDAEFKVIMDGRKYRQKDIDRAKAFVARYIPELPDLESQAKESWLVRFIKSKKQSEPNTP